jgi:hypothetical protein
VVPTGSGEVEEAQCSDGALSSSPFASLYFTLTDGASSTRAGFV